MPAVYNRYKGGIPKGAVYIGRPGPWGNPFVIGADGDRTAIIEKFKVWLAGHPELVEDIKRELAGRDLVCFCAPAACHGDVLLAVANPEISVARPPAAPAAPVAGSTGDLFAEPQDAITNGHRDRDRGGVAPDSPRG